MKILWEAFAGIAVALTTSLLVIGAIVLAITEGMVLPTAEPVEDVPTLDPMLTIQFAFTTPTQPRSKPQLVAAPTLTPTPPCPPPPGWEPYTVLKGDTLPALAKAFQTTKELIVQQNCLESTSLFPKMMLYLPPVPTATPTEVVPTKTFTPLPVTSTTCPTAPAGWVKYIVRSGDTIFRIGYNYGITADVLRKANCLGSSNLIYPGEILYVPNVAPRYTATMVPSRTPTRTKPAPTRTFTVRPTLTFTNTSTTIPPTSTFTPTATHTGSAPTATFTPTFTPTDTPANTPTPTPSNTPTPTNTSTATPTGTFTPTNTSTPTVTMTATDTPIVP